MRVCAWDLLFLCLLASNFGASAEVKQPPLASVNFQLLASLLPFTLGLFATPTHGYYAQSSANAVVQDDDDCSIVDIIFLIDSSGSIGWSNWQLMLVFIEETIRGLSNVTSNVRYGLVTFSSSANVQFDLNDYDAQGALKAVSRIPYARGWTNMAAAFRVARQQVWSTGRRSATKLVILLSDGQPNQERYKTEPQAQRVKDMGAHVVSVGVTDNVDKALLKRIGTTYRDALTSKDFKSLHDHVHELVSTSCRNPIGLECQVADIALIVETSGSIAQRDWNLKLDFLERFIQKVMSGHDVRFALVDFSSDAEVVFNFAKYSTTNAVVQAMRGMPYYGEGTNIAGGLMKARSLFNERRPKAARIAILFTNGKHGPNYPGTLSQADKLKAKGVHLIPVEVTNSIDHDRMQQIASTPQDVVTSQDFDSLASKLYNVIGRACGPTRYCRQSDVVIAVDTSASIGPGNKQRLLSLVEDTIRSIDKEGRDVHFGLIQFSYYANVLLYLQPRDLLQVISVVKRMPFSGGGLTDMTSAFKFANVVFRYSTRQYAAKKSTARMLLLITDGRPKNKEISLANILKDKGGVKIAAIGVTENVDAALLTQVASSANDVFLAPNFTSLAPPKIEELMTNLCNSDSMVP